MQVVIFISQVLSIVTLCVIAFIVYHSIKAARMGKAKVNDLIKDKAFMKLMREADLEHSKYEPDELLENWQNGYVISLKTYLQLMFESIYSFHYPLNKLDVHAAILVVNEMQVIKEMNIRFYLKDQDPIHYKPYIYIYDQGTKKEWSAEPHNNEKLYQ